MASPVAHTFAGYWTFLFLIRQVSSLYLIRSRPYLIKLGALVLLANLPDLDFLFGLGWRANELHRGFTHSLLAAIAVSLLLASFWRITAGYWRSAAIYFLAYGSHLVIDLCTGVKLGWNHTGYGIPLFWPWPQQFTSSLILLYGVRHATLGALFSLDNLWSCAYELVVLGGLTLVLFALPAIYRHLNLLLCVLKLYVLKLIGGSMHLRRD